MARQHHPHHHGFPRPIARFLQLEGGQYGTVDLLALTPHRLEMQLGADFVQFTRRQAEDLRDAIQLFIEVGEDRPPPSHRHEGDEEVVEVVEEVIAERDVVVEEGRRRRGRRS